jgi:hypothetical protein
MPVKNFFESKPYFLKYCKTIPDFLTGFTFIESKTIGHLPTGTF